MTRGLVLSLVMLGWVSACGPSVERISTTEVDGGYTLDASSDVLFDPVGRVAALEQNGADPALVDMLRDGRLTFAEYEQAVLNMVACAGEAGIAIVMLGVDDRGDYPRVNYAIPAEVGGMLEQEVLATVDRCTAQYSSAAEIIWQLGHSRRDEQFAKDQSGGRHLAGFG